ncbi:hypothetical protein B0B51_23190 (plasmid) [blood disease bacterium A2-HR MARDI]|uniref:Molybdate ABC transporter substrate-binding protein n=2 Tax=Ralstonia syzygii subsp. celebesensis TaxID=1310168 RepID=A0A1U9VPT4_9RALS|nr:hypothetical protein B0B51_23190 [blood disease bacterium A2-HR MARDI]CCA83747.1 exported hypothetical protein [blood disease bacterium R229]
MRAVGLAAALSLGLCAQAQAAELVVSAAASLTNAFKTLAQSYEAQHPDTKIVLNFGASDVLMQQIARGAPADVFASADRGRERLRYAVLLRRGEFMRRQRAACRSAR